MQAVDPDPDGGLLDARGWPAGDRHVEGPRNPGEVVAGEGVARPVERGYGDHGDSAGPGATGGTETKRANPAPKILLLNAVLSNIRPLTEAIGAGRVRPRIVLVSVVEPRARLSRGKLARSPLAQRVIVCGPWP